MHGLIEPVHSILYFAPEATQAYEKLGLEPRGQGYVAGRAAPLGPVGPDTVTAVFFNFNPAMIAAALPAAWQTTTPAAVLAARAEAMQQLYTRVDAPTGDLAEATELARRAAQSASIEGRPLAAANRAVEPSGLPFADLWQALAVLREYRGDGHVALLTAEGIGAVEALVVYAGWQGTVSARFLRKSRMWDDDAWSSAEERLAARGLWQDGALTEQGQALRDQLENRTDELAANPWTALGADSVLRLFDLLRPLVEALNDGEAFPRPLRVPERPLR